MWGDAFPVPFILSCAKYAHFWWCGIWCHLVAFLNIRFRFHTVFPFVIQTDALINSLQTAKSKSIMYIIYINASIQIWVSTCNKKPFLKILRASLPWQSWWMLLLHAWRILHWFTDFRVERNIIWCFRPLKLFKTTSTDNRFRIDS